MQPSAPHARSKHCSHARFQGSPCGECSDVHRHIVHLSEIARDTKHHTNYKFLGLGHMQDIAKTYADQIKQLKLQELNHSHKYMRLLTQLDDYNRLLMAISKKDIPRIHQIVDVALHHGSSVQEVVNKLEDALEGAYTPRGYGANDLDITTLVVRLGGCQLLFALHQSLGLPSLCTLHTKSTFTSIFDQNIQNIKHSHTIEPVLRTYESAVNIAQKLHDGELHLGKELTVIGASCFGEDEIYPILAAPTCKTEDATDMEHILSRAIGSWNRTELVGPIWHAAGHKLFVKFPLPLPPESPLYGTLVNLQGLNLFTSEGEIMLDFDFKHIFKHKYFFLL
ncbi:uncharacterized protein F5891DRAFT_1131378 [Suillus fuscotomentosus]|uniref:Uncharacterized protein n=1 Tax=Suillus fuscotomentosus TaxID=1912939 RepID=A0AAD4DU26_9AGAM|nr:uncharacterized protein F5891DRAFT_1131378 [Suillus fuscotomentosus]KAG1893164.1 hypothetical protein F5891DRAFT_1131378 [Suillus fuscotomentosus]